MTRITVCGAGNAAHTLVPLLAADGHHAITVFAPLGDEAARWQSLLADGSQVTLHYADGRQLVARPDSITANPSAAVQDADMVLLALPAFAHETILLSLAPYLAPTAWIGALPARGGFNWLVHAVMPAHQGVIFGLQTLPWACRVRHWGQDVEVLGTKVQVDLAVASGDLVPEVARRLGKLFDVNLRCASGFLALTLANTGQLIHPGIMYGLFHDWDGVSIDEDRIPFFYAGIEQDTADVLQGLSDDIQALRASLESQAPHLDLASVEPLDAWLRRSYGGQIQDSNTLQSCFNTNRAYEGLRAPMQLVAESGLRTASEAEERRKYQPWFTSRYLAEDVPFGLLVTRGIAELAGIDLPMVDQVLTWAQDRLGKEYLTRGRVAGRDLPGSRAPQRFGIDTLKALLQAA